MYICMLINNNTLVMLSKGGLQSEHSLIVKACDLRVSVGNVLFGVVLQSNQRGAAAT